MGGFVNDLELMFRNCVFYNKAESYIVTVCKQLMKKCDKFYKKHNIKKDVVLNESNNEVNESQINRMCSAISRLSEEKLGDLVNLFKKYKIATDMPDNKVR